MQQKIVGKMNSETLVNSTHSINRPSNSFKINNAPPAICVETTVLGILGESGQGIICCFIQAIKAASLTIPM